MTLTLTQATNPPTQVPDTTVDEAIRALLFDDPNIGQDRVFRALKEHFTDSKLKVGARSLCVCLLHIHAAQS